MPLPGPYDRDGMTNSTLNYELPASGDPSLLPARPVIRVCPECPAPDRQGQPGEGVGQAGENRQIHGQSRHLHQRSLTWASLLPCGDYVGIVTQDGDSLLLPGWASRSQTEEIMHLVQLGKLRHRDCQEDLASCHLVRFSAPAGTGCCPLTFPLPLSCNRTLAAPGRGSGSWSEGTTSAIQPSMLCPPPAIVASPPSPQPHQPHPLQSARPGPLRITQRILKMGLPPRHLGPLIRNGWGAPSWGREGARRGDRQRERRLRDVRAFPPALLPHSTALELDEPSQWPHTVQSEGVLEKRSRTSQSQGPTCRAGARLGWRTKTCAI